MKLKPAPLSDDSLCKKASCGSKSHVLAVLGGNGFQIPGGFCLGAGYYKSFLGSEGLAEKIMLELSRKRHEDMRWEELWDASLRIRNLFLNTRMPDAVSEDILDAVGKYCGKKPLAIRSSGLSEDGRESSFAGIHESFVGIRGKENTLKSVKLVWASLWSDRALAYRKELLLDVSLSAMGVIVQEMFEGEKSGVAFSINPQDENQAVIESVRGINKGLVDGDVEPERYLLDRYSGKILNKSAPAKKGGPDSPPEEDILNDGEIAELFNSIKRIEKIFGAPQDVEWTYLDGSLRILQARPITTLNIEREGNRRSFDLSLRRSFDSLKMLGKKIEEVYIPEMTEEALRFSGTGMTALSDIQLEDELKSRKESFEKWKNIYWEHFIPFGHGVRLLGEIYNDRMSPEDPYEFLGLLDGAMTMSFERNEKLLTLAERMKSGGRENLNAEIEEFIRDFGVMMPGSDNPDEQKNFIFSFLAKLDAKKHRKRSRDDKGDMLREKFIKSFKSGEKSYAEELIRLAGQSYKMRDDDNIYLGRIEAELNRAEAESRRRSGAKCAGDYGCESYEESIGTVKNPGEEPAGLREETASRAARIRGQSASKGIARGTARVINQTEDLREFLKGEILVCDSINPNMTFIIPLASGIVERRGGMLVHGAIIAREYGIPCVTGIPDAAEIIKTGDTVTVDGYFGLVTLHP